MNEEEIGYPIYRMNEIHDLLCDLEVDKYADITFKEAKKFILKDGDVLFNRTNSFEWVGRTGIYYKNELDDRDYVFASYLVRFNTDKNIILPEYLNVFLNCKYGVLDIKRRARQSINQTNVNPEEVKEMQIPILSMELQDRLRECLISASGKEKQSKNLYYSAENLLIAELGLENFNPSNEKVSIKSLKESFLKTGRLDSEYYQVKYDEYLQKIKLNKHTTISNEFDLIKEKMKSGLGSYNYIEIGDVNVSDGRSKPNLIAEEDLPANAKILPRKGDLLISKVRPNRGAVSIIEEDYSNLVVSGAFAVLREKKESECKVEILKTLLRTPIYSDWLLKFNAGTSYPVITDEDILSLPIPILRSNVQEEIADYIGQSMEYSKKAKELLNISTKAVEIAIDTNEETAHNFLDRQTDRQTLIAYYEEQASYYLRLAVFRLYEEIGLFDELKSVNYTVKNLKDTFAISGRLDSEYYQEKYDRLFDELSKNKTDKLSNLAKINKSIEPGSDNYQTEGIPFVRVQDLSEFGLSEPSVFLSDKKFKDTITPKKDTILLSKDGSVGIAYKISEAENIITSSAILHLEVKDKNILPDYLTLVLNSIAVKMQAEQDAGGSIINHWKISEIENVIIPIIEKEKQEKISGLLIESERLRNESKFILDKAVRAVEIAIEDGEDKAISYLN